MVQAKAAASKREDQAATQHRADVQTEHRCRYADVHSLTTMVRAGPAEGAARVVVTETAEEVSRLRRAMATQEELVLVVRKMEERLLQTELNSKPEIQALQA